MPLPLDAARLDNEWELAAIFEGVPLLLVLLDKESRVLWGNQQAADFVGMPTTKMLGRCFGEVVGCPNAEETEDGCGTGVYCRECRVKAVVAAALHTGKSTPQQEGRHQFRVDGRLKELILSVSAIPLTVRDEPSLLLALHDLTAHRALEQELQQTQRLESIGALSGGIAHDFNNILNAISGYTDLAIADCQGNQAVLDDLAEIRKAAAQAADLVRKLSSFSRRHREGKVPMGEAVPVTEERTPAPVTRAPGQARIMVVDDEFPIRDVMSRFLEKDGFLVETFANGLDAWKCLSATPEAWDLLVLDQNMPGLTGRQLAAKALALRPDWPIILCSGEFRVNDDALSQPLGLFATMSKPFGYNDLRQRITEALAPVSSPAGDGAPG